MTTMPTIKPHRFDTTPATRLTVDDILHAFGTLPDGDSCPTDALRAALADPEAVTPALLAVLDQSPDRILEVQDAHLERDAEYYTHVCAMFLLAAFGEPRAFAKIVRFFHRHPETDGPLSGERAHHVVGDLVTSDLPLILAATYDGDCGPLLDMIVDTACDEFVRIAGVEAMFHMVAAGKLPRDEAIAYLGTLLARVPQNETPEFFWEMFVLIAVRFGAERLAPQLRALITAEWFDSREMPVDEFERLHAMPWAEHVAKHYKPETLTDLVGHLSEGLGWYWPDGFVPGTKKDNTEANLDIIRQIAEILKGRETQRLLDQMLRTPIKHVEPKLGRNDPCSCGSGKKFKKCCIDD